MDAAGKLIEGKLPDEALKNYHGVLGHYHLTTAKVDPDPAFDWERVIGRARELMAPPAAAKQTVAMGKLRR